jgi:hypothetical protein
MGRMVYGLPSPGKKDLYAAHNLELISMAGLTIIEPMTQAVAKIIREVEELTSDEYIDLFDEMILRRPEMQVSAEVEQSQLDEVKSRIEEVESGKVQLLDLDQALAEVRALVQ